MHPPHDTSRTLRVDTPVSRGMSRWNDTTDPRRRARSRRTRRDATRRGNRARDHRTRDRSPIVTARGRRRWRGRDLDSGAIARSIARSISSLSLSRARVWIVCARDTYLGDDGGASGDALLRARGSRRERDQSGVQRQGDHDCVCV